MTVLWGQVGTSRVAFFRKAVLVIIADWIRLQDGSRYGRPKAISWISENARLELMTAPFLFSQDRGIHRLNAALSHVGRCTHGPRCDWVYLLHWQRRPPLLCRRWRTSSSSPTGWRPASSWCGISGGPSPRSRVCSTSGVRRGLGLLGVLGLTTNLISHQPTWGSSATNSWDSWCQ